MNGSSISLEPLLNEHPTEADCIRRLEHLLSNASTAGGRHRWTLDRLCDLVRPRSKEELAVILGEVVALGLLKPEIHVESPRTHAVIARFDDLRDVPEELPDASTGLRVVVAPEDLRLVYVRPAK